MKLTNTIRDAFVRAAMNDVPAVDYDEKIRQATLTAVLNTLPSQVLAIHADEKTRDYLKTRSVALAGGVSVMVPVRDDGWDRGSKIARQISDSDRHGLEKLAAEKTAQDAAREKLEDNLRAAAYSVTTRKALASLLPEFARYLPAETPPACRTVPALANLAADFAAAGWPKGGAA